MKESQLWKRLWIACLMLALLTSCATAAQEIPTQEPTSMPIVPTATPGPRSCEEVEGTCMVLSFDGSNCTYDGPSDLKAGRVTLLFFNNGGGRAAVNLMRHLGDESIQDMIDLIGEEPITGPPPIWANPVNTWQVIRSGETYAWEGSLKPGIHTMVCASVQYGMWYGGGFRAED